MTLLQNYFTAFFYDAVANGYEHNVLEAKNSSPFPAISNVGHFNTPWRLQVGQKIVDELKYQVACRG